MMLDGQETAAEGYGSERKTEKCKLKLILNALDLKYIKNIFVKWNLKSALLRKKSFAFLSTGNRKLHICSMLK